MSGLSLKVLAAGSLRAVWQPLMASFTLQSGIEVDTRFGPAGLLRESIEQGERPDLFASANIAHPQRLKALGLASRVEVFTRNRLCLTARQELLAAQPSWLALLGNRALKVGTSTPLADPSGDYTWQLFDTLERHHAGLGEYLKQSSLKLVGGAASQSVPNGELAAAWLIRGGQCDLFVGYASYARRLRLCKDLAVIDIPENYNIQADYAFAQCYEAANPLSDFLLSTAAQEILFREGFARNL